MDLEAEFEQVRQRAIHVAAEDAIDAIHDLTEVRCAGIEGRNRSAAGLTEEEARDRLAEALLALYAI